MDHYNEQLIRKQSEPKDMFLRILIVFLTLVIIVITIGAVVMFGFMPLILIAVGACYLAYILLGATSIEYEYIVTNNDLDIDKIMGKSKRKRLITVKLNTVKEWGEYTAGKTLPSNVNATVMASDATGKNTWYILAEHEKHGTVMVIFNPSDETLGNINFGVPHSARKKLAVKKAAEEEISNESVNETENQE